ncbi:beta-glucosidase [Agreia bicolorata]|uniref:Beta-glucosidase n=1 Tax=Agreia bicolorata TaxID=110935 RepID=A0A1T4WTR6_9MICO|nr:family 1 glycosylhydrolase [Agreia bicolorata]KJC64230.1 beta-glucosidase [Agreia bicolorata]SKA80248.1 beta-glucosidase [Agreia bicolorata]
MTDFLWGASTSPHQVEGNNLNSDWWAQEQAFPQLFERSGDALDSYHRYAEDMKLLADAGLNAYRFGIEWARIEPVEGHISRAELAHYRRMIDAALEAGLTPVVTIQHFTVPAWFKRAGGWLAPEAIDRFRSFVAASTEILADVPYIITINEPNVLALMSLREPMMRAIEDGTFDQNAAAADHSEALARVVPPLAIGDRLIEAHAAAREILRASVSGKVGWSVAGQAFQSTPGNEDRFAEIKYVWEDKFLEASREDDFIGVQAYTSQLIDAVGIVPHVEDPANTLNGWAYRPDALGIAVRNAADVTGGIPALITENGIATADDERRIAYTSEALAHLAEAMAEGIDVRGYLHWSALDNYEWGDWESTFGLIAVDRTTFARHPKPSLGWLGRVARRGVPTSESLAAAR